MSMSRLTYRFSSRKRVNQLRFIFLNFLVLFKLAISEDVLNVKSGDMWNNGFNLTMTLRHNMTQIKTGKCKIVHYHYVRINNSFADFIYFTVACNSLNPVNV